MSIGALRRDVCTHPCAYRAELVSFDHDVRDHRADDRSNDTAHPVRSAGSHRRPAGRVAARLMSTTPVKHGVLGNPIPGGSKEEHA